MKKIFLSTAILFIFICNSYGQTRDAEKYIVEANQKVAAHDYKAAVSLYNEALAINPKDAMTYYNRGITKLNLSEIPGACIDFKKAKELGYKKADEIIEKFCK